MLPYLLLLPRRVVAYMQQITHLRVVDKEDLSSDKESDSLCARRGREAT